MKQLLPIIFCLVSCGTALYFIFDTHEKRIHKIEKQDSVFTAKMNLKITQLDSINALLMKRDTTQSINYNNLQKRIESTKKTSDSYRDSIGFLPEL